MTDESRRIRILVTGTDAQGRSRVVGEEHIDFVANPEYPGFGTAEVFETASAPPPPRPDGRGARLETALAPGIARWQVIAYAPGLDYPMHHTDTVDFDLVLAGSIELTLDDGVHLLETGDGVVMNGVDHAWQAGPDGCRLSVMHLGTPPRS
jgi:quercetin dioxygenase-like cupin family protein